MLELTIKLVLGDIFVHDYLQDNPSFQKLDGAMGEAFGICFFMNAAQLLKGDFEIHEFVIRGHAVEDFMLAAEACRQLREKTDEVLIEPSWHCCLGLFLGNCIQLALRWHCVGLLCAF